MAIISTTKPGAGGGGGGDVGFTVYESFAEMRTIIAVPGKKYMLLNNFFALFYFVSFDVVSPDSEPNTIIAANGYRLKIVGSE